MRMKTILEPTTTRRSATAARVHFTDRCLASCRKMLAQIKSIKRGILDEFRGRLDEHEHLLELAVNEAEALAWQSGFPQLLFPALAQEKAQSVARWHSRQEFVRRESASEAAG